MGNKFIANCPHCEASLELDSDWIGSAVECTQCNQEFTVEPPVEDDFAPQMTPTPQQSLQFAPQQQQFAPPPQQQFAPPPQQQFAPPPPQQFAPPPPPQFAPQPPQQQNPTPLILGIVAMVVGVLICTPIGVVLAAIGLSMSTKQKNKTALIINIVALSISILFLLLGLIIFLILLATGEL